MSTNASAGTTASSSNVLDSAPLRPLSRWLGKLLMPAFFLAVVAITIVPLLFTLNAAFYKETRVGLSSERSLDAVMAVYFSSQYYQYLGNALLLALIVTVLAMLAGIAMAIVISRTDCPAKKALDLLIIAPLFVSPFTGLIAWIMLGSEKTGFINSIVAAIGKFFGLQLGPLVNIWSFGGVVWILVIFFAPFSYLFTIGQFRSMDSSLEEAARMNGAGAFRTLFSITVPLAMPAVLSSGLLVFILAAEIYTIPGIIASGAGFVTLPWQIYVDSTVYPVHRAHAAAAGTMLLWITVFGVWLQRRMTRRTQRFVTVTGKGFKGKPLPLGAWRWPTFLAIVAYVLLAVLLPFAGLITASLMRYSGTSITRENFTLNHYTELMQLPNAISAFGNTIWLAGATGAACVVIGLVISFLDVRRPGIFSRILAFVGVMPVAVPGLIYGIGLMWMYLRTPLYGTPLVLLLAYIAKFLPYGIMISRSSIIQVHPELEESARMSGAPPHTVMTKIVMPILKPALISILLFVILMCIKEMSASILLYSPRTEVLSVLTWNYMDSGNYQFAAAVGVIQSLMMLMIILFVRWLFKADVTKAFAK